MRAFLIRRRRALLIGWGVIAVAAVALVAILVGGGDGGEDAASGSDAGDPAGRSAAPPSGRELDELVNGVILAGFEGSDPDAGLGEPPFGGVLVRSSNWDGARAGRKLTAAIRDLGSKDGATPPLIAVAQEGGPYRELADLPPEQRQIEIGSTGEPAKAASWMEGSAKALRDSGFDLDLAPVADVATLDSPIADRAFSDDPAVAAEMTAAAVEACGDAGIACAPSHFPGLGGASANTDAGPASVGLDAATLEGRDLVPFRAAFRAGAPAVVVSNAFYSAYDPVTPAALTPAITTDLLRDDLGFEGVAISDDLAGGAVSAVSTAGDAAVRAVAAGIDLVQISDPGKVDDVRRALAAAVEDGTLDPGRLREAAGRVGELREDAADG